MVRHSRSRDPGIVKLASGVVIGGVGLGAVISLAIDTEMNGPAASTRSFSERPEAVYPIADDNWLNAGIGLSLSPGEHRIDLDYESDAGVEMVLDSRAGSAPPLPIEEVAEPLEAPAARDRPTSQASEPASEPNKPHLAQEGLY